MKTILATVAIAAAAIALTQSFWTTPSRFDSSFHQRITGMERGTEKYEVLELLGAPWRSDSVCCLPKRKELQPEIDKANASRAVEFLCWRNGPENVYCVGFDEHQRMIVLVQGR